MIGYLIAFAMVTEPSNQSSCELHLQSEDTIRVIPTTTTPTTAVLQVESSTSEHGDEGDNFSTQTVAKLCLSSPEAVYYELENPTEVTTAAGDTEGAHTVMRCNMMIAPEELTRTRSKSSNSYTSISSESECGQWSVSVT